MSAVTVVRPCVDFLDSDCVSVEAYTCCIGVELTRGKRLQNDALI